jgi:hypothetical protein
MNLLQGMMNRVRKSFFLMGLLSLIWLIFRPGAKPSRITYPCQRAAASSGSLWLTIYVLPLILTLSSRDLDGLRKRNLLFALAVFLIITIAGIILLNSAADNARLASQSISLKFAETKSANPLASDIFVVNGTDGNDNGVEKLIELMDEHGLPFYQLENKGIGLISRDDIVILKVNSQWDERGGTNTDLAKALIKAIVSHPAGFTGEVIIADNGQAQYGSTGRGGSLNYGRNNAQDIAQSMQVVAESIPDHNVSTYLWDDITTKRVEEYSQGDMADGYVLSDKPDEDTGIIVSYPKFTTKYGTRVSFKMGIWNSTNSTYDSDRLKVINVPVLKSHGGYGVTASVKHYMGVVSDKLSREKGGRAHNAVGTGGMGTQLVETRLPTLNILDAIWINADPRGGPATSYTAATNTNVIAASIDPVALDRWAAKNILMLAARAKGHKDLSSMDPDNRNPGSFGYWLELSADEIRKAGYIVNDKDESINVYIIDIGI